MSEAEGVDHAFEDAESVTFRMELAGLVDLAVWGGVSDRDLFSGVEGLVAPEDVISGDGGVEGAFFVLRVIASGEVSCVVVAPVRIFPVREDDSVCVRIEAEHEGIDGGVRDIALMEVIESEGIFEEAGVPAGNIVVEIVLSGGEILRAEFFLRGEGRSAAVEESAGVREREILSEHDEVDDVIRFASGVVEAEVIGDLEGWVLVMRSDEGRSGDGVSIESDMVSQGVEEV